MMCRTVRLVEIDCTPDQLRTIASRLDSAWASVKLGETVPYESIFGPGVECRFRVNQEQMKEVGVRKLLTGVPINGLIAVGGTKGIVVDKNPQDKTIEVLFTTGLRINYDWTRTNPEVVHYGQGKVVLNLESA